MVKKGTTLHLDSSALTAATLELVSEGVALMSFSLTAVTLTSLVSPRLSLELKLAAVNLEKALTKSSSHLK